MGANGFKSIIFDHISKKIGVTELNAIADVEIEDGRIWITLEDGSIKSLVVVNAGRTETQKLE